MERRPAVGAGPSAPAARAGGFTLVEILVVLAILATLIGMVAAMIPMAMRNKDKLRASTMVLKVGSELSALRLDQDAFGKYPPTRTRDLKFGKTMVGKELGQSNDINVGAETVHFLLNNPDVKANQITSDEDLVGNTDEDSFRTARGNASDAFAREYLDPWGMPLVYINSLDYKDPRNVTTYRSLDGTVVEVKPKRLSQKLGGAFMNPNSFQLFSLGPNGQQDPDDAEESDDICYEGQ